MAICGCVSAANLRWQTTVIENHSLKTAPRCGILKVSGKTNALSFGGSESMGHSLKIKYPRAVGLRPRTGVCPLQVCFLEGKFCFQNNSHKVAC